MKWKKYESSPVEYAYVGRVSLYVKPNLARWQFTCSGLGVYSAREFKDAPPLFTTKKGAKEAAQRYAAREMKKILARQKPAREVLKLLGVR